MQDEFAINPPELLDVQLRRIESTRFPLLVVDNFLRDPDRARKRATGLDYQPLGEGRPGLQSRPQLSPDTLEGIAAVIEEHLGPELAWEVPGRDEPRRVCRWS